ncbi:MAG: hypothetical protein D4R83_02950, partial [Streptomycetaceae bacterium]
KEINGYSYVTHQQADGVFRHTSLRYYFVVSHFYAENPKVSRHAKRSHIGIDLWHAVEFSRYGCALLLEIALHFQGRLTNLVQRRLCGQTA